MEGWKSSLQHIRVWGRLPEVRVYNQQERKSEPRSIRRYFIGYAEKSKGYRFIVTAAELCNQEMQSFVRMTSLVGLINLKI